MWQTLLFNVGGLIVAGLMTLIFSGLTPKNPMRKLGVGPYTKNLLEHFKLPPGKRSLPTFRIVALHQSDCLVKLLLPFLSQLSDKINVNTCFVLVIDTP